MSTILQLETSAKRCSVALSVNNETVASEGITQDGYVHAEMLHVLIDQVIKNAGIALKEVDAIAVSKGPGSYTGLRIGVSAAKGLCYALDKPLIAIDTTSLIAKYAFQLAPDATQCVAMIDARRMEVYCGVFNRQKRLSADRAVIVDEVFLQEHSNPNIVFAGDGADKVQKLANNGFCVHHFMPSAEMMTGPATKKYNNKEFEIAALFEPYYLKEYLPGVTKKTLL